MEDDQRRIIEEDSLNTENDKSKISSNTSEGLPISPAKVKLDVANENDIKSIRLIIGLGVALSVLSTVALGIAYGTGAKEIKLSGMVNTDCALCADMGADILKMEGSAVDAAITTILCNGLVNMHSSGLGGGGYMMIRDHKQGISLAVDFIPTAGMIATPEKYTNNQDLLFGKKAVAVPGELAGLVLAHKYYGKLEWDKLVSPVAKLARKGFPITKDIKYSVDHRPGLLQILSSSEKTNLINLVVDGKTGRGKEEGTMITRPDYAQALDLIAKDPDNFYLSDIGQDIIDSVNGNITLEDLSSYKAIATEILKMNYSDYVLETPGPPAGGAALLHMLKILEGYKFSPADIAKDLTVHRVIEAMKFGFAAYPNIAEFNDTEQSKEFTQNMLSAQHCEKLRLNITDNSTHDESYYNPQYDVLPTEGTSVVTAIDNDELFVSSISSLNSHFGSAVMTKKYGIILNNFLDAYDHAVDGLLPKHGINNNNIVKGGRRPRSAMAPVIFYNRHRKCKKRGVVGSTGGLKAIPATLQYLLNILSFDATPEDSNKRPRYYNTLIPNTTHVEDNLPTETMNSLRNKLHFTVSHDKPLTSTSAGYKEAKQIFSAADTRVEGKSVVIDK